MSLGPTVLVALALMGVPFAAIAQRGAEAGPRIDPLTGEPFRPRGAEPRRQAEIVNAPHAPLQPRPNPADDPPIDILVTPQLGAGAGMQSGTQSGTPFRR